MWLYRLLSRPFPRSYGAKLSLVAGVGAIVPPIGLALLVHLDPSALADFRDLGVVAGAVLAWTGVLLLALRALLRPLRLVAERLDDWQEGWHPGHLPQSYSDEPGRLMRQINRLMDQACAVMGRAASTSHIDPLTGLLNRQGLEEQLAEGAPGWVLCFGVDNLDTIAHRWGRDAALETVRGVARHARGALRPGDILARPEDGNLIALLPALAPEEVRAVADRLRRAVEVGVRTKVGFTPVSIGLAQHTGGPGGDVTMGKAVAALAQARRLGRSRICEASTLVEAA